MARAKETKKSAEQRPAKSGGGSRPAPAWLGAVAGIVKLVAILVGLVSTVLCLASLVGLATSSGWIRFPVAILAALVVPAVLTDRLLPKDQPESARGLLTDVFSLTWLGVPVLYAVLLAPVTSDALRQEGDRLAAAGAGGIARLTYLLAGVQASFPQSVPAPANSAAASAEGKKGDPAKPAPSAPPRASTSPGANASAAPKDAGAKAPDAGDTGDPRDRTPAELFKELAPTVVAIVQMVGDHQAGGGTGFAIDDKGTIVTNHHVISGAKGIRIKFINGAIYEDVELLADNEPTDLALLRVEIRKPKEGDVPEFEPIELGNSDDVVVGEQAIAIGNPLGLEHTLTDGLVSSRRKYEGKNWIQISVPVSPGNSGGPLFNMRGEVIGITTAQIGAMFGRAQNLNLAVPVNELKSMVKDDYPGRRKFGSSGGPSSW